jgi:Flp pilus assembly protein TadD
MGLYRIDRTSNGSDVAYPTTWDQEVAERAGYAAGAALGAGMDLAGSAFRNARDRRMVVAARALHAASEGDADEFLELASKFTRRYPHEEFGHANLAHALFRKGQYGDALDAVDRAAELGLDEWEAHRMRAEIYEEAGYTQAAVQTYTRLLQNPAYRSIGLLGRASCLVDLGDLDQALVDANEAVSVLPSAESYFMRGCVHRLKGDFQRSLADCTRAIQLVPDSSDLLESRAEVYEFLGQAECARRDRAAAGALM